MPDLRNKCVAGNICFLLFVVFLAMTAVGTVKVGEAIAAEFTDEDWEYGYEYDEESEERSEYSADSLEAYIWVTPLTNPGDTGSFDYYFRLFTSTTAAEPYKTSSAVEAEVYDSVYVSGAAYTNLLQLVYGPPPEWALDPDYRVTFWRVYEDTAHNAVYVDLLYRPPTGGGGGGGGGVTVPTTVVSSPTGDIVVTPSAGSAVLVVDEDVVSAAIEALEAGVKEFVAADLSKVEATDLAATLVSSIIRAAVEKGVNLKFDYGSVVCWVPPGAVDPETVEEAGAGASLQIRSRFLDETTSTNLQSTAVASGLIPSSNVVTLEAALVRGSQTVGDVGRFDRRVRIALSYTPKPGIPSWQLGVYRRDPDTGEWVYVGGKVLEATNQVIANLWHFSDYAVMAYSKTFADIVTHWAKSDVEMMASKHVVRGVSDTEFAPNGQVTRAQFAAMLLRSLGLEEYTPDRETFIDVSKTSWYYGAVEGAFRAGLVKGYEDGTFRPDATVTREQMAAMLIRAMNVAGQTVTVSAADIESLLARFTDRDTVSSWAKEAVAGAARSGLLEGRTHTTFEPQGIGTRAEAAVMMKRLLVATGDL